MDAWPLVPRPADGAPFPYLLPGIGGATAWLHAHGLTRGRRLGIVAENCPAFAALLQAGARSGVTLSVFNHRLASAELAAQIRDDLVDAIAAGDARTVAGSLPLPETFRDEPLPHATPLADDDPALIVRTSGSSGPAKAVRLTWGALGAAARASAQWLALTSADRWVACLPLDHVGGAATVLRAGFSGCALHLLRRFDAPTVAAALADGASGTSLVPTMLHRIVEQRAGAPWPRTLRQLLIGGAALPAPLATRAAALGVPTTASYGMTETAGMICAGDSTLSAQVGTPLPGMEIRIDDPEADGAGVIATRGSQLFAGYERCGRLERPHSSDAWFATGDRGRLVDGRLVVIGRRDDVIVSGGEKVDPAEVEEALLAHPAIGEAAVCGLPDPEWGQIVAAAMVARSADHPSDADLAKWVQERLSAWKRPRRWTWMAHLPRLANGKLQRILLAPLITAEDQ